MGNNVPVTNYHCSVIRLADIGILVKGPPQSGKSSLIMGLLQHAKNNQIPAEFICDDQALILMQNGSLFAKAPDITAGKIEIFGYGIVTLPHAVQTKIDLIAQLVPSQEIERMPEPKHATLLGIELPIAEVPAGHESQSIRIICATCGLI